jgi:hypothetical protein
MRRMSGVRPYSKNGELRADDTANAALFLGGPLDGQHLEVCPWQRVHYVVRGGKPVAWYVRRHLPSGTALPFDFSPGPD